MDGLERIINQLPSELEAAAISSLDALLASFSKCSLPELEGQALDIAEQDHTAVNRG